MITLLCQPRIPIRIVRATHVLTFQIALRSMALGNSPNPKFIGASAVPAVDDVILSAMAHQ